MQEIAVAQAFGIAPWEAEAARCSADPERRAWYWRCVAWLEAQNDRAESDQRVAEMTHGVI